MQIYEEIQKWSKDKILYKISLSDSEKKVSDLSSIDKAFRQFKEYDLPIRTDKAEIILPKKQA